MVISPGLLSAQTLFYEDQFAGGVVGGGYSPGIVTVGSGSFTMPIPAGSTIRKAYFFGCRAGGAPATVATLNSTPYTFDFSNMVSTSFNSLYGGASGVHAHDVTAALSASTLNYTISVTNANSTSNTYPEFYLLIAYDNSSLPNMNVSVWLNDASFGTQVNYTLTPSVGVDTSGDVGLAIVGGYANAGNDCEEV